jgi:branched-chain amino acid transport system substrate-binding protein
MATSKRVKRGENILGGEGESIEGSRNNKSKKEEEEMKSLLKICLIGLFAMVMAAPTAGLGKEPIKLGMPNALSGHGAPYAVPMVQGAKVAIQEINKKGGVLGRPFELILRDHKGSAESASRQAEELILKEKVDFLSGTIYSSTALAISAVAKKHKVLFMDCGVRTTVLTENEGHRYVGSISVDCAYEGRAMAMFDKDTPNKKYWIIGSDYAYGRDAVKYFQERIKQLKPDSEILGETWVKMGETEFTTPIGAIVRAKPDMLVSVLITGAFQAFAIQSRPYGLFKKPVITVPLVMHTELMRPLGKDFPDGAIGSTKYIQGFLNTPASNAFEKLYLDTTKEKFVPAFAADGYILMWLFAKAIEKAGTTETEAVINALKGLTMETPKGKMTIRGCDLKCDLGEWWGVSKYDPSLGYSVITNVKYIPALELMHTCEEVQAIRPK